MKTNLKILAAVVLGMAGIFGLTVISQFTVQPPKPIEGEPGPSGEPGSSGPPLLFQTSEMKYDPTSEDIAARTFEGFFEVSDREHRVGFWFKNHRPVPVTLMAKDRSCTACTSARAAVVSQPMLAKYALAAAPAGLPWGLVAAPDLMSALAAVEMDKQLAWTVYQFEPGSDPVLTIPPATNGEPVVGLISLGFKAKSPGPPTPKTATFVAGTPDGIEYPYMLAVTFTPATPFSTIPANVLEVGTIGETGGPTQAEFYVLSTTRSPLELPPPSIAGAGEFVSVGKPIPVEGRELEALAAKLSGPEAGQAVRLRSGYRIPVTVVGDVPGKTPDIGAFTKVLDIAIPGTEHTARMQIKGRMTGVVRLADAEKIDLGAYNPDFAKRATATIVADRTDIDLELVPSRSSPLFVQYTLDPPQMADGKKTWQLKVTIPAKDGRRPGWDGVVVLQTKGAVSTIVRFPVSGNGLGR